MSAAIAEARRVLAAKSKSFALAGRVLGGDARDRAAVVYAFCRRADDAIDLAPTGEHAAALARLRRELDAVYGGRPTGDAVLDAFGEVARACRIPRDYPAELLAGLEMDAAGTRYGSLAELGVYCYRVAGTVGLMMCHVLGLRHDRALPRAVHLGIAMQLTNICRDVAEDWQLGRLYLPADMLAEEGAPDLAGSLGGPFPPAARGRSPGWSAACSPRPSASTPRPIAASSTCRRGRRSRCASRAWSTRRSAASWPGAGTIRWPGARWCRPARSWRWWRWRERVVRSPWPPGARGNRGFQIESSSSRPTC